MIATILNIVLLLYAFFQYNKGRYAWPLFILVFFASNAFIINIGEPVIKYMDFGLLLLFGCSVLGSLRDSSFFKIKKDTGAKIALFFVLFFVFELIYSYLFNIDTIGNILSVVRTYLYALTYFVFRKAPTRDLKKGIILIFKAVILASSLFVIQYITHLPLTESYISETNLQEGNYRMQSTPPFISLILLSLLFYVKKVYWRWGIIVLIFVLMLISQNRTPLIALFLEIGMFVLFAKRVKHKFSVLIVALCAFPFLNSLLESRSSDENSVLDVSVLSYLRDGDYVGLARQNSFVFRIALIAERADYLLDNPDLLLQGVGAMYEDTAQKKFKFLVGTGGYDEVKHCYVISQLDSIDVVWGPLLIRYGFLGMALHLFVVIWMIIVFYKKRSNPIMMLGFLTYVAAIAQSFSSGGLFLLQGILTMMGFLIIYDRNISYSVERRNLIQN